MGTKKDRIAKDLKEQNRLKRGSKNIQNKYIRRESLNDMGNYNVVVTYLEPNILECEVKWALGSTAANKAG